MRDALSATSMGQASAALGAAAGQNLTAVAGGHSLAEAVLFGALTLLGLIGTFRCHVETPPVRIAALLRAALTRHRLKGGAVNRSRPHDRGATDIIQTV